jgi:hypothetical protein
MRKRDRAWEQDGSERRRPGRPPPGEAPAEQRVSPVARLQLRHLEFGSDNRLFGIDALAENAVLRLTERVNGSIGHQLLHHP